MSAVAATRFNRNARTGGSLPRSRLIGVLISAVVPALFWTAALALAGVLLGTPFDFTTLGMVAAAIAVFLAFVAAVTLAADDASDE